MTGPEPISTEHDLTGFDSGQATLDNWLVSHALKNELGGGSRTYVVSEGGVVTAYYCLSASSVAHTIASGNIRRNMPDPIPVMLLGRLAVRRTHQGNGIARLLVRDAILRTLQASEILGIRAMLVHAIDKNAAGFYRYLGFDESPIDPLILMQPLSTVRKALRGSTQKLSRL